MSGVTAHQLANRRPILPRARIVSTLILAPLVLGAVFAGAEAFSAIIVVAALAMGWEWGRMTAGGRTGPVCWVIMTVVGAAVLCAAFAWFHAAIALAGVGCLAAYGAARAGGHEGAGWSLPAPIVIALPAISLVWLRAEPDVGRDQILFIFGAVWLTDLGAYFFGRLIGGPKLAPRLSPRKTWAGLIGGVCCAAGGGWASAGLLHVAPAYPLILIAALGAPLAQAGDLGISALKRRFGFKDASNLIPGHGGVLDRTDGLLTTAPALTLLVLLKQGDVFTW